MVTSYISLFQTKTALAAKYPVRIDVQGITQKELSEAGVGVDPKSQAL